MAQREPNNRPRFYKRYLDDGETNMPYTTMRRRRNHLEFMEPDVDQNHDLRQPVAMQPPNRNAGTEAEGTGDADGEQEVDDMTVMDEEHLMMREEALLVQNVAEPQHGEDAESDVNSNEDADEEVPPGNPEEHIHGLNFLGGDQQISSEGSDMKKIDSLLMVLSYAVKHHLSGVALQDLIELINLHCPNTLPSSKYLFHGTLTDYKGLCQFHFYCKCKMYIGCGDDIQFICNECGAEFSREESIKGGQFFIVLPLAQQLHHLLQYTEVGDTILNRDLKIDASDEDDLTDITDGVKYREMKKDGLLANPENFSLLWNSDGVPIFKSSQTSIWPVLVMINELPIKMRRKNIMLTALWFGESKPEMSVFLKPFIDECQKLSIEGLSWKMGQDEKISKVFSLVCTTDSVARPLLQNTTQFNGFFGCGFCKQRGEYTDGAVRYPYMDPPPPKRKDQETKHTSLLAQESGRVIEGVKGVSIVSLLTYFNIVSGFIADYMHAVCLGTVKRFMTMWIDPANRQKEWYIGRLKQEIDKRLRNAKVTKEVSRLPRHLKDLKFWKAISALLASRAGKVLTADKSRWRGKLSLSGKLDVQVLAIFPQLRFGKIATSSLPRDSSPITFTNSDYLLTFKSSVAATVDSKIEQLTKTLTKQMENKGREINEYREKHNLKVRGEQPPDQAPMEKSDSSGSAGVLVSKDT
ncbi:uncharacterized protein LOC121419571 [Lytechinus variegatus]|uniref:uncharacterized protein LOC121419571 n=1 Tax=Lytechinus variegatus TaxID=7654 RepID=UPI001BB253F7|nr:uncharacterized protein LOC121419571 [Lytechinus variegatus]